MSDENLNFNEVDETENETPVEGNVTELRFLPIIIQVILLPVR